MGHLKVFVHTFYSKLWEEYIDQELRISKPFIVAITKAVMIADALENQINEGERISANSFSILNLIETHSWHKKTYYQTSKELNMELIIV